MMFVTAVEPLPPRIRATSAGRIIATFALSCLWLIPPTAASSQWTKDKHVVGQDVLLPPSVGIAPYPGAPVPADHTFTLRHIYHHGTRRYPRLHRRLDIAHEVSSRVFLAAEDGHAEEELSPLKAKSRAKPIERLVDRRPFFVDSIVEQARRKGLVAVLDASAWTVDEIPFPDVTDKGTVVNLAYMAADAYVDTESRPDWEDVGQPFNKSDDFGWEGDGLRGHIWADDSNSTIVIGLKGTSPAVFDGDGTTTKDKINDNLFFSCCCAQQGQWTWHKVCDCATDTYSCNNTCVKRALREEDRYYGAARELYSNVTERYPNSTIWLVGHSLGGAVSSLLGLTYGLPVVTFEAVPEALAATRLGLPVPPGADPNAPQTRKYTGAFHFGHTADPVYIGTCNGATASCSFAGYAMETTCHTGSECVYDVVSDKGWRVGIGTHKIRAVISDVLLVYDNVPQCNLTPECRDCAEWKMYESNSTKSKTTSTSSTTTRSRTRTTTCQSPGWWGCLDEPTTTGPSTTTTSLSTSTCKTPGWFGCLDTTTTTEFSTTPTTSVSTSTCKTPGKFWGCWDKTSTSTSTSTCSPDLPTTSSPVSSSSVFVSTFTCENPGKLWGCWNDDQDIPSAASRPPISPSRPSLTQTTPTETEMRATPMGTDSWEDKCIQWSWDGSCRLWQSETRNDNFDSEEM